MAFWRLQLSVLLLGSVAFFAACDQRAPSSPESKTASKTAASSNSDLWHVYEQSFKGAKYIDLTHTITPSIPVWKGFAQVKFAPTINPETKQPYTYKKDGFEATHYDLPTDQYGTQLDPPAHWAPEYPAIDELPATYAVRPLVVISIVDQVAKDRGYHLKRLDVERWEKNNGKIPPGSVVMGVRIGRRTGPIRRSPPRKYSQACHWRRSNFCTRNGTSFFTATSHSTPTPLRRSREKIG